MQRVDLYTADRIFIKTREISPFDFPPEVLVWKKRVFKFAWSGQGTWAYHEAFACFLEERSSVTVLRPLEAT